ASFSLAPDIGLQVFADDTCAAPVSSVAIGPAPSVLVRVRGVTTGTTVLRADAPGLDPAQTSIDVVGGPPVSLAVLSAPQHVLSGDCSAPVLLELRDVGGNPASARANL